MLAMIRFGRGAQDEARAVAPLEPDDLREPWGDVPAGRAVAPLEPDDDLREPWGDVPATPAGTEPRRPDPVPAGARRAYRRWIEED